MVHVRDTPFPPGTVGFITGTTPRYYEFSDCLERLYVPKGSGMVRAGSCNPAGNTNNIVKGMEGDWLWHQGDDHVFAPKTLMRLLEIAYGDPGADIVVPLVSRRGPPFQSVIYSKFNGDPQDPGGTCYSWDDIQAARASGATTLPLAAAGSSGMLCKRAVYDKLREVYGEPLFRIGTMFKDELTEDTDFTWRAGLQGFRVVAALNVMMGHLTSTSIEPFVMANNQLAMTAVIGGERAMLFTAGVGGGPGPSHGQPSAGQMS